MKIKFVYINIWCLFISNRFNNQISAILGKYITDLCLSFIIVFLTENGAQRGTYRYGLVFYKSKPLSQIAWFRTQFGPSIPYNISNSEMALKLLLPMHLSRWNPSRPQRMLNISSQLGWWCKFRWSIHDADRALSPKPIRAYSKPWLHCSFR